MGRWWWASNGGGGPEMVGGSTNKGRTRRGAPLNGASVFPTKLVTRS